MTTPEQPDPERRREFGAWALGRWRRERRSMPAVGPVTSAGLTPDGRLRSGRLAGLSMNRAIWVLSWPVLVESFLNSLVGVTDTALAARLDDGTAATDAIAGASYIMWFIGLIFMALGIGATALISRSVGKGRFAVANAVLGQTLTLGVVIGLVTAVFIAFASRPVAGLLQMTERAGASFGDYMLVIAGGVPFATILFALIACARGAGDSISPLYAMMVRNAVNIGVSWALSGASVGGFEGPFDLGVVGIAIGTVAGDIAGVAVVLTMAVRGSWGIRLIGRRLRPHWHTMRRIVRLGVPNFLETLGMWVGNFVIILMVGWLGAARGGDGLLGTHMVAIRIEAFSFLAGFAMGAAAATLAGQYLGAGAPDMARRAIGRCAMIAAGVMFVFGLVFLFAPEVPTRMLSDQPIHLEIVPQLLIVCGFIQIPFGLAIVTRGAMRGAGDVRVVMTITWVCTYLIRIPLGYFISGVDIPLPGYLETVTVVLPGVPGGEAAFVIVDPGRVIENPSPIDGGLVGLWIGLCAEHIIRCACFLARFVQGGWSRVRV